MKKNNFLKSSGFYVLIFLAIILVIEGVQTLSRQKAAKA